MDKKDLPTISGPKVTQEVFDKAAELPRLVRRHGHPRAIQGDIIGALIDAATPESAARALDGYNVKLGAALADLDKDA
jgi:hypothetical protein